MMSGQSEFSVYWQDPDGNWNPELCWIKAEDAVQLAFSLSRRPAAKVGVIREIKITDGGDHCVFHWLFGKGVVFPEKLEESKRAGR
jgi:hypothetical protein